MTKRITFLLSVLMLVLLSSCDDDKPNYRDDVSKVYREANLTLTLNGVEKNYKSVHFFTKDMLTAEITVKNTIPGEDNILFSNVKLEPLIGCLGCNFSAEDQTADRLIKIDGSLNQGKLAVDVTYESLSSISGIWALAKYPLTLRVVPSEGNEYINMHGFYGKDEIPVNPSVSEDPEEDESFEQLINEGITPLLGMLLNLSIDLQKSGDLVASWSSILSDGQSKEGMVRYNTKEDLIYVAVALDSLLFKKEEAEQPTTRSTEDTSTPGFDIGKDLVPLYDLIASVYKGLPLIIVPGEDSNKMSVMVNREMMVPYASSIMNVAAIFLKDIDLSGAGDFGGFLEELGITKTFIQEFPKELVKLIETSEEFELSINLERSNEKVAPMQKEEVKALLQREVVKLKNKKK